MEDAGCDADSIEKICRLYRAGRVQDAVRVLQKNRGNLMGKLHESQDKVDSLDFLVRLLEKEQKQINRKAGIVK